MSPGFFHFDVQSFHLNVLAGQKLAIVLFVRPGGSDLGWFGAEGNPYVLGVPYEEQPPNHNWTFPDSFDLGFRTHVAIPEPSSMLLCAAAGVGAALARRKAAFRVAA